MLCQQLQRVLLLCVKILVFLGIKIKNLVIMWLEATEKLWAMQIFWNFLRPHNTLRSKLWQACRRQRLSCHNLYIFCINIICYAHLMLLVWWVSTFSHILLLVKRNINKCAFIEMKMKWKSVCFFCHVSVVPFMTSLIHSLPCVSTGDVPNTKQHHEKCSTNKLT
jgi:hypothetical protein